MTGTESTLVPLEALGNSAASDTTCSANSISSIRIPPSQSCFMHNSSQSVPTPEIKGSMHSCSSTSSSFACDSNGSLAQLDAESLLQTRQSSRSRNTTEEDRHSVVFDEAKMTRRIEKDIRRGRLVRARSSDSFLEQTVEISRRQMRSYLSFGYGSSASLDVLSRQLQEQDRTRSSFSTLCESELAVKSLNRKNETFDLRVADRLRRSSAAASAGRALLSR